MYLLREEVRREVQGPPPDGSYVLYLETRRIKARNSG